MDKKGGGSPSLSADVDLDTDFVHPWQELRPAIPINPHTEEPLPKQMPNEPVFDSGISSIASTSLTETESFNSVTKSWGNGGSEISKLSSRLCKVSLKDEGIGSISQSFSESFKSDNLKENLSDSKSVDEQIVPESVTKLSVQYPNKDDGYHSFRSQSSDSKEISNENMNQTEVDIEDVLGDTDEDGDTLIHTAVVSGDEWVAIEMINLLVFQSRCLDIMNELFQTVLHLAVLTEQRKIVQKLVSKGCDITIRDKQGNTPLHIACRKGSEKLVKDMVGSLADNPTKRKELFSIRNCEGLTCLHLAAQGKHYEIMGYLFARGADVNIGDAKSGRTILHYAVENKDVETVVVLLTHPSIDIDCETYKGETPLLLAYWRNYQDIVKRLKANGAFFSYDLVEDDDEGDDS